MILYNETILYFDQFCNIGQLLSSKAQITKSVRKSALLSPFKVNLRSFKVKHKHQKVRYAAYTSLLDDVVCCDGKCCW